MKKTLLLIVSFVFLFSCSEKEEDSPLVTSNSNNTEVLLSKQELKEGAISNLKKLGYQDSDIKILNDGVIIQGDIFSSFEDAIDLSLFNPEDIDNTDIAKQYQSSRVARINFNRGGRVKASRGPIPFKIWLQGTFSKKYHDALDIAIQRFNNVPDSNLKFVKDCKSSRTGCSADVNIKRNDKLGSGILGEAGFPRGLGGKGGIFNKTAGRIYGSINLNVNLIDNSNYTVEALATLIAHELGHCVGFRHTDWFARVCDNGKSEGDAKHIPGTTKGIDANSWMISCLNSRTNRPFTKDDIRAIQFLF